MLGLLSLIGSAHQSPDPARLGYTRDQILSMGDDKWFDLYESKKGDSPEALTAACKTYAEALHERNFERIDKLKQADRLKRWYADVKQYGDLMLRIQSRNMDPAWVPVAAAQQVDLEELFDRVVDLEVKPDKTPPPDLKACGQRVLAHHDIVSHRLSEIPANPAIGLSRQDIAEANASAIVVLKQLTPQLVKAGGQGAYAVFVYCSKLSSPEVLFGAK
jgi:hypothetical protein